MAWVDQRGISSETSNPYEPWQNGHAKRIIQTLNATVMFDGGLAGRFWFLALQYATHIHNLQYSAVIDSSTYLRLHRVKPDVSGNQCFGVEA